MQHPGRGLAIPKAPLIVGAAWFLLVLAGIFISKKYNTPVELCIFKRITGIPCPTCGSTTGGFLILQGKLLRGWLSNPLVFTLLPLIFINITLQVITGYRLRLNYSGKKRIYITILLLVGIAVNWGYLMIRETGI